MNNWNKQDVESVIEGLQVNKMIKIKDQIFIRTGGDDLDELELNLDLLTRVCGGAGILTLDAAALLTIHTTNPGTSATGLMKLVDRLSGKFHCVSLTNGLFKPEYAEHLRFCIAHELGHLSFGHQLQYDYQTETYIENEQHEFDADTYGVELLGRNEGARLTFEKFLEIINGAEQNEKAIAARESILRRMNNIL